MACSLAVIVTPKSGKNEIVGMRGDELHVRVTAAPEDGKANKAVQKLLASELNLPKSNVTLQRGDTSHHKLFAIELSDEALSSWLSRFTKE